MNTMNMGMVIPAVMEDAITDGFSLGMRQLFGNTFKTVLYQVFYGRCSKLLAIVYLLIFAVLNIVLLEMAYQKTDAKGGMES